MAKLYTWNVNGLRACLKKGFQDWFQSVNADVVCLQETKSQQFQVEPELFIPQGYSRHWFSAQKPGYSGVLTYSKEDPEWAKVGFLGEKNNPVFTVAADEGRVQTLAFKNFVLVNAYFPNSQPDGKRLSVKLEFCREMKVHLDHLVEAFKKPVFLTGDFNIAHQEIDLKNPHSNHTTAGFLPEERAWMGEFLSAGYFDIFRHFYPKEEGQYTWWSYRPGVRERNVGWRIDTFCGDKRAIETTKKIWIEPKVMGSDHCPVGIEI